VVVWWFDWWFVEGLSPSEPKEPKTLAPAVDGVAPEPK